MEKTLKFQSRLTCTALGQEVEFESNVVFVTILASNAIHQKSLLVDRGCFDIATPQDLVYERKTFCRKEGYLCLLLIYLLCG